MRFHSINRRRQTIEDGNRPPRGQLAHLSFWAHGVPRVILACRILGHKATVDGTEPLSNLPGTSPGYRWVCCDRCGVRPDPQGNLNLDNWRIGQRYRGPHVSRPNADFAELKRLGTGFYPPGLFPAKPTGTLGGEIVIGRPGFGSSIGFEFKVGNGGSEHTLAAAVRFGWLGVLSLHTERFGTWLQRRLNPTGYESRVTGIEIGSGWLRWRLWAKSDGWSSNDRNPWWQQADIDLRILDRIRGPKRYDYTDIPGSEGVHLVRMPEGDDHPVILKLQRCVLGRRRGRKVASWSVDWVAPEGIPAKRGGRSRIHGSGVTVSDLAVREGTWPAEAAAAIALFVSQRRTNEGGWLVCPPACAEGHTYDGSCTAARKENPVGK